MLIVTCSFLVMIFPWILGQSSPSEGILSHAPAVLGTATIDDDMVDTQQWDRHHQVDAPVLGLASTSLHVPLPLRSQFWHLLILPYHDGRKDALRLLWRAPPSLA